MKRTAPLIVVITILSKFVGLAEMVLAYFYGASSVSDAYLISMTIPTTIFALSWCICSVFIPMYTQVEAELGVKEADKYTNNLVNILLLICTNNLIWANLYEQLVTSLL